MCHRQAVHFLKKSDYRSALKFIEQARMSYLKTSDGELDDQFIAIVSTQSVCLLKLGDFITSKRFAEQVLRHRLSSEAQFVKAESLYNLCHFEHSLVTFHRGISHNTLNFQHLIIDLMIM